MTRAGISPNRTTARSSTVRDWAAEKAAPYCHAKLAQKDVNFTQTFDVADRIIARWKENLLKLNALEPLVVEGEKVDVTPE